jgi:serine/threonine protein kinase
MADPQKPDETPPTLHISQMPAEQATLAAAGQIAQNAPGSGANTVISLGGRAVQFQDLLIDKLLLAAPRVNVEGRSVPSLGGIPLLTKLGQGGMGAVYYGIHPRLETEVAVKVLPFHLGEQQPALIDRFFREAKLAAKIESSHLVGVKDVNQDNGLYYLVMEYVAGQSAGSYLRSIRELGRQGLEESTALDICIAATEGLAAAHARGIIHRDIKPDNILLPKCAAEDRLDFPAAKLADLGLARGEDSAQSLTTSQQSMGTPGYMSPEQALDAKKAGKQSDVFSMGATLYALLSGQAPFSGSSTMEVLLGTMQKPHAPISQLCPKVTVVSAALLERCLGKDPAARFVDGTALLEALRVARKALGEPAVTQDRAIEQLAMLQKAAEAGLPAVLTPVSVNSTLPSHASPSMVHGGTPAVPSPVIQIVAPSAPARSSTPWLGVVAVLLALGLIGGLIFMLSGRDRSAGVTYVSNNNGGNMYFLNAAEFFAEYEKEKGRRIDDEDLRRKLDEVSAKVKSGDYANAIPILEQLAPKLPSAALYSNLGVLYASTDRLREARIAYKTAVESNPKFQPVRLNLGLLERDAGRTKEAAELFASAPDIEEARKQATAITAATARTAVGAEVEPNNDILTPSELTLGSIISGKIGEKNDADFFRFSSPSIHRDRIEIVVTNKSTSLKPVLCLYGPDKSRLADPYNNTPGGNLEHKFVAQPATVYYLQISSLYESSTGDYTVQARPARDYDDFEPNEDILSAVALPVAQPVQAKISDAHDSDFYKFQASTGKTKITASIDNRSTTLRPWLGGFDARKSKLNDASENTPGANLELTFKIAPGSVFYIQVASTYSGTAGEYTLTIKEE